MTPPTAVSQYDFDIQLGSGKRFTCRVESREARSKWIQAIEAARSAGIPDCPLCKPTDPPDVQELTADLWPLHFSFEQWRAKLAAKATAAAEAMLAAAAEATVAGSGNRVSLLPPQRMYTACALCHIGRSGGPQHAGPLPMDRQSSARGKRAPCPRQTIAPRRRPRCTTYTFRSTSPCRSRAP